MPNGWIIALKRWNSGKQTWCLPKKGTDAYNEVMALMPEKKLKEPAEPKKAEPAMKIPMEQQRKPMSDKDAPKIKFVEPAKKVDAPPIIPQVIKKEMKRKLYTTYETHEYKMGLAHPIRDMIKWFKKVQSQDTYWGKDSKVAYAFLSDLITWVSKNSHKAQEYPFGDHGRTEQVLMDSDWERFVKANK